MSRKKMTTTPDELKAKAVSANVQTEAPQKPPKKTKKVSAKKTTEPSAEKKKTVKKATAKKVTKTKVAKKAPAAKKVTAKKAPASKPASTLVERSELNTPKGAARVAAAFQNANSSLSTNFGGKTPPKATKTPKTKDLTPSEAAVVDKGPWTISSDDLHFFNEGRHFHLHHKLGAHPAVRKGVKGFSFTVWAPNAESVSVFGSFNDWNKEAHKMEPVGHSGLWNTFVGGVDKGQSYKFYINSKFNGYSVDKADPFAFYSEVAPQTASLTWNSDYQWKDSSWMKNRLESQALDQAMSVYELHLGSWKRKHDDNYYSLSYRELAEELPKYVKDMGFTHIELMPITEHPFFGSWGYQTTGYFAPTSRYGNPDDLKFLIDALHKEGIGVLLDWVPSHFPSDEMGLNFFDGTHLFEHADPREGFHQDWNSMIFNFGRNEVRSFLISSAMYWLEEFHIDGLRVDAVASMLYRDYSRKEGEWVPNEHGGRENYEAISFLRQLNEALYSHHPGIQMIAEESTAWPMVSRPTSMGGLGFGQKWDMGWMHDTLHYFQEDPVHRKYHHSELSFRMVYAFNENFVLSISHDEVVHGKGSLLNKMPGDMWQKFANMRNFFAYMYSQPGKKLLFMGTEFGQWHEWNHDAELEWHLLNETPHQNLQKVVRDLNGLYKSLPALYETDFDPKGFEWVENNDWEQSVYSFLRFDKARDQIVLVVLNMTPIPRHNYQLGVPVGGSWSEIFNSDAREYGGSGHGNMGAVTANPTPAHGRNFSVNLTVPPLGAVYLKTERPKNGKDKFAWGSFK